MGTTRENLLAKVQELPAIYLEELATYLEFLFWKAQSTKPTAEMTAVENDPLIGLFAGDPDLAEQSEEIFENNPRFFQILEEARQRVGVTGGVSFSEFRERVAERNAMSNEKDQENEA